MIIKDMKLVDTHRNKNWREFTGEGPSAVGDILQFVPVGKGPSLSTDEEWVEYGRDPAIYERGRAAHDAVADGVVRRAAAEARRAGCLVSVHGQDLYVMCLPNKGHRFVW